MDKVWCEGESAKGIEVFFRTARKCIFPVAYIYQVMSLSIIPAALIKLVSRGFFWAFSGHAESKLPKSVSKLKEP